MSQYSRAYRRIGPTRSGYALNTPTRTPAFAIGSRVHGCSQFWGTKCVITNSTAKKDGRRQVK